ncbi:MAG: lysophospholipid acyltransferase family protein, partial [Pirellulaceae bacterium]
PRKENAVTKALLCMHYCHWSVIGGLLGYRPQGSMLRKIDQGDLEGGIPRVAVREGGMELEPESSSDERSTGKSPRILGKLIDLLFYLLFRLAVSMIQMLPTDRAGRLAGLFASFATHVVPFRRELIETNLRAVYPNWSPQQITLMRWRMWEHLALFVCETALAGRKIHRTNWRDHFSTNDRLELFRFMLDERPKIIVSGHFGNFELAGFFSGLLGLPSSNIARPLDNPHINAFVAQFRAQGGQFLIPKNGSSFLIERHLRAGGTLGLLADQDAGSKGCWVDFLGRPASCHKALALFTLSTGAPMMVFSNIRLRPLHFRMRLEVIADPLVGGTCCEGVRQLTGWYNDRLAEAILRTPEQYWWLHRRWREPPPRASRTWNRAA